MRHKMPYKKHNILLQFFLNASPPTTETIYPSSLKVLGQLRDPNACPYNIL